MSQDEQSSRSLRMAGKKKSDGPNWFMIAGGAVVMAVSVAFGRKKILCERAPANGGAARNHPQPDDDVDDDDDEAGSVHTYETVDNGAPFLDKAESAAGFEFRGFKAKRPAPSEASPMQASKLCRQLSRNSVCQSNQDPVPSDTHMSTTLRARREMVHRLRQQIRSRDAMIYDMQTQLADQEQMITMHRNHSADLQECVQAVSVKLFEANLEVQRLHRELSAQPVSDLDDECIDIAVAEIQRNWMHPKDVEEILFEARRSNEEVERLRREKEAKDNLAQAKSRQCELLAKQVSSLATELEEVKSAAKGKQRLLEAKEQENLKLTSALHDLQQKLQIESRDNEWARSSKLSRRTDALNINSSWKANHCVDRPVTPPNFEEASSTYVARDAHHNFHQTESVSFGKPYASVHARNDSQQDSEDSVAKAESDAHSKRFEQDDGIIDEALIQRFENEVDQVASALSLTSKVVSERMQAATQVLKKFQEHCEPRTDVQSDAKAFDFSQVFHCLSESMSAEERQELRLELEQAARQQDVEREMKVLAKHQTKLEELKYVMAKASAKNTEDYTLQLASIEQKLALQEDIAEETSSLVKQLSTLFHVPSPQSPPIQELWRTVKETSGATTSVNGHHTQSGNSRNAVGEEMQASRTPERLGESSSAANLYQFHLGASDGPVVSTSSRLRRAFVRKATPNLDTGSKRQPTISDVFSFGSHLPPTTYEQDQGDRMSSPEPEMSLFRPETSPSFAKRCRSGGEASTARILTPAKPPLCDEDDADFQIKRSTEESSAHSDGGCTSPFATRLACLESPVRSLREFDLVREEEVAHLVDREVESEDSSGSCDAEEARSFLPSLLRRSNSSSRRP